MDRWSHSPFASQHSIARRNGSKIHLATEYSQQFSNRNRILRVINCAGRSAKERKKCNKVLTNCSCLNNPSPSDRCTIQSVRLCDYNKLIKFASADNPPCDVTDRCNWAREKIEFIITINSYTNASFEFNDQPRDASLLRLGFIVINFSCATRQCEPFSTAQCCAIPFDSSV